MRAVITVIGKDTTGIIAAVSNVLKERDINILDINQSVMSDMFVMVMLVDISRGNVDFASLSDELVALGDKMGLKILAMHEDIFNTMHRI
ncbi:MAG: ACT domain-containing protein [Oscillospiraceae bacterium]|nr:ACT domain-containing protein [Oscillospiraceae bacterium]